MLKTLTHLAYRFRESGLIEEAIVRSNLWWAVFLKCLGTGYCLLNQCVSPKAPSFDFLTTQNLNSMSIAKQYRPVVGAAAKAAAAIGVPGAFSFGLDVVGMGTIWAAMIREIAQRSGHEVDMQYAKKIACGIAAGAGAYIGGSKLAMKLLHLIPGAGTLAAIGVNSFMNFLFTYKLGHGLSKMFEKGSYDDSDAAQAVIVLLGVVAVLPSWGEMHDMYALWSHDIDPEMFEHFKDLVKKG